MTDTCIIYDDATEKLANALKVAHSIPFNNANDDEGLHDFVMNYINQPDFNYTKLIIPCNLGHQSSVFDFMGINLGLHIRLTTELKEKRLISLTFIDNRSIEEILTAQVEKTGYLLATKGCKLVKPNGSLIKNAVENAQFPLATELKTIINHLVLLSPEDTLSRHSIANQWGAMKLNEVAEVNALGADSDVLKKKKLLYYKWLLTRHEDNELEETVTTKTKYRLPGLKIVQQVSKAIESTGKKILLIDDEADKGWSDVLSKIFSNKTFFFVPPNENQGIFLSEARRMIAEQDWDLILLDLRLIAEDHDRDKLVDNFMGTTLLKEIKNTNNGTQVIIFTASNKAWNMQKLMFEYEADGYYIKESPDFDFGKKFTKENYDNFKKQVKTAFERDYLRWFYKKHETLETSIDELKSSISGRREKRLYDHISKNLEQSYAALKANKNNENRFFEYAYLNYYQLLENVAKLFYLNERTTDEDYINTSLGIKKVIYQRGENYYSSIELIKNGNRIVSARANEIDENIYENMGTLFKICALLLLKHNANDADVRAFVQLNRLRNEVVAHAKKDSRTVSINQLKEMYKLIYWLLTNTKHA